jgi:ribosomal protein S18 acetylase RimI-like enzyme
MLAAVTARRGGGRYDRLMTTDDARQEIRTARSSDVGAIAALHLASWSAAYKGLVPDEFLAQITLDSRIVRWGDALDRSKSPLTETVVADDDGTVLGVCSFGFRRSPPSVAVGEVYSLHVRPDVTRQGLGKRLLDEAVRRLAWRGVDSSVLWVLRDNANARRFYESQGWTFTGEEMVEDRSGFAIPETRYAIVIESTE